MTKAQRLSAVEAEYDTKLTIAWAEYTAKVKALLAAVDTELGTPNVAQAQAGKYLDQYLSAVAERNAKIAAIEAG